MELVGKEILSAFKNEHPEARSQVEAWEVEVEDADWKTPHDLKSRYPKASLPGKQQVIFDICWNEYRLWVKIAYNTGIVIVKAIGTHKEYEKWPIQ
jgi:mRNA interferase HigB